MMNLGDLKKYCRSVSRVDIELFREDKKKYDRLIWNRDNERRKCEAKPYWVREHTLLPFYEDSNLFISSESIYYEQDPTCTVYAHVLRYLESFLDPLMKKLTSAYDELENKNINWARIDPNHISYSVDIYSKANIELIEYFLNNKGFILIDREVDPVTKETKSVMKHI